MLATFDEILPLAARIMISAVFIAGAYTKLTGWNASLVSVTAHHLPMPSVLLLIALLVELLGSVCLITGFQAAMAAVVMFSYLIPVTFIFHDVGSIHFLKNLAIMGGLLMIAAYGPGRLSLRRSLTRV